MSGDHSVHQMRGTRGGLGRWGPTGWGSEVGSIGPLNVLSSQPETRFAKRFLFWQAVVVCAGAKPEG